MAPSSRAASHPTVNVGEGTYLGTHFPAEPGDYPRAVDAFYDIPYGTSTSGRNRFRRARVAEGPRLGEQRDARKVGMGAPTTGGGWEDEGEREDCLNLQIYRTAGVESKAWKAGDGLLPIVLFFHGGMFNFGTSMARDLRSMVSWARTPMVVVAANYRLGVLGFLGGAQVHALEHEASENYGDKGPGTLNAGIWDAMLALDWVSHNAEGFGGDEDNITLMGSSAGAHMVGHILTVYAAASQRPFRRAILESGAATARCVLSTVHPRTTEQFSAFLAAAGVRLAPVPELLDALRELSVQELCAAAGKVWARDSPSLCWPFQPVVDGPRGLIWGAPSLAPRADEVPAPAAPLLTGFCTHEGALFVPREINSRAAFREFFTRLIPGGLTSADLDELEALYPLPDDDGTVNASHWRRAEAVYAHWAYITPVLHSAHAACGAARVYEWAALSTPFGLACHTDSALGMTHEMQVLEGRAGLRAAAERMHAQVVEFAAGGEGEGCLGEWPAFVSPLGDGREPDGTPGRGRIMVFGKGNDELMHEVGGCRGTAWEVRDMTAHEIAACRFWWSRRHLSEGIHAQAG
ncbi:hypothetical protein BROUX41_005159 [Berkeleyomyces rouxiae]|uniref:uncharacterized protein n=1 Tax=Berkeleyomyces rouxiae TaxID=2035830 RepID=UPI003B8146AF